MCLVDIYEIIDQVDLTDDIEVGQAIRQLASLLESNTDLTNAVRSLLSQQMIAYSREIAKTDQLVEQSNDEK